ncbi:hypothetical protein TNIN_59171 [Trichonephila inaurata madagascariensis]|uniref:Uncharacterized protein n=1 Tax=Trichonephila inaurata madagascariensis TaxID=2747483 RepID=A0A8X6JEB9_9ARAC|nr:hypothetical protein TNIN_59171 [Trichonephila inaurata madagascariensis]
MAGGFEHHVQWKKRLGEYACWCDLLHFFGVHYLSVVFSNDPVFILLYINELFSNSIQQEWQLCTSMNQGNAYGVVLQVEAAGIQLSDVSYRHILRSFYISDAAIRS